MNLSIKYYAKLKELQNAREDLLQAYSTKIAQGADPNALFNNFALQCSAKRYLTKAIEGVSL